jgi:hypothetical protein
MLEEAEISASIIQKLAFRKDPKEALATSDSRIYLCMIHVSAPYNSFLLIQTKCIPRNQLPALLLSPILATCNYTYELKDINENQHEHHVIANLHE